MSQVRVTPAGKAHLVEIEGPDGLALAERVAHTHREVENAIIEMGYRKVTGWAPDADGEGGHVATVTESAPTPSPFDSLIR